MKERGILFTPENVQLILDGAKVQTRRIVKLAASGRIKLAGSPRNWHPQDPEAVQACPFGTVGDRLYLREGLYRYSNGIAYKRPPPCYRSVTWRWKKNTLSPRYMPKDCARLWLEITNVRIERVQDISQHDAAEEGCGDDLIVPPRCRIRYEAIWSGIHGYTGEDSWAANPYVWAISFRRIKS